LRPAWPGSGFASMRRALVILSRPQRCSGNKTALPDAAGSTPQTGV